MPDINLNFNLDGNNDLIIVSGRDEYEQSAQKRLLTRQGELFYDTVLGLDWEQVISISEKTITQATTELEVRRLLLEDSNISTVEDITISDLSSTRNRSISFTVTFTDGTTSTGEVTV